jgi:hypothetical protein
MRRAVLVGLLLLVGSAVLGATVLREPIAWAAAPVSSVFVSNDASRPVPVREVNTDGGGAIKVHEQGTVAVSEEVATELIARQIINAAVPALTVDVSSYREIRLASNGWGCDGGATVSLSMLAVESGASYPIDAIPVCDAGTSVGVKAMRDALNRTYEIPGRTLRLEITGDGGIGLAIFGRRN